MDIMFSIAPPIPITQTNYVCEKTFLLGPIKELYYNRPYYGLLLINARESSFWLANDLEIRKIKDVKTSITNSHKNGGSSQGRFDRLFENKRDRNHTYIVEQILNNYYDASVNAPTVIGFIIGGAAETRTHVWDAPELSHLIKWIITNVPLSNNNPYELWELSAEKRIKFSNLTTDAIIDEIDEIMQLTPDKVDFALTEVSQGLNNMLYSRVYTNATCKEELTKIKSKSEKCRLIEINGDYLDQYGGCVGIKYMN